MRRLVITTAALGFALGLGISAYQVRVAGGTEVSTSLAGTWRLSLRGSEGSVTVPVALEQRGAGITGIMADAIAGASPVTGTVTGRTLSFSATITGEAGTLVLQFTGQLQEDGTLSGVVSSPTAEIPWSAQRISGQNATRPVLRHPPSSHSA